MVSKDVMLSLALALGLTSLSDGAPVDANSAMSTGRSSYGKRVEDQATTMMYDFEDIEASRELEWTPCFESFRCAKLTVPLQYDDPAQGDMDIAYIRYDSVNGTGQDIMYNPGGPGSSGVSGLIGSLKDFIKTFGSEYNFVSFDPRGVNNSGTILSCESGYPQFSSPAPINVLWAQTKVSGENCTRNNVNTTARFDGTVANVQDMIHFTELQAKANGRDPAKEKIWYYGVSYGTLMGQTLAALYPDRLGRIILDSNVDGVFQYEGYDPTQFEGLEIEIKNYFFKWCSEAGADFCPLAANTTDASGVQQRYDTVLKKLDEEPYILPDSNRIITRESMEDSNFNSWYSPPSGFYGIAKRIAEAYSDTLTEADFPTEDGESLGDATQMVNCIDAAGRFPFKSAKEYEQAVNAVRNSSSEYWWKSFASTDALSCNGFNILPPKSQLFPGFKETKTSIPILFINDLGDPVTPLVSAFRMSAFFPGSRVLTVDAPGHSFLATGSQCVDQHARAYLKDGTMPPEDAICNIDVTPTEVFARGKDAFETISSPPDES
ncbi:unnamed protein product [Periconia digitata]|uniref:Peptidase S33 tripeptidyl aminopeptidase-like C-terminal domain-containing protein n=1 Tax=Periconia digitata TaxID=1303443 RepID=A0A9W4UKE0_9PLEO|nr:unnamed protein product [Periconia digitata]